MTVAVTVTLVGEALNVNLGAKLGVINGILGPGCRAACTSQSKLKALKTLVLIEISDFAPKAMIRHCCSLP